MKILSYNIRGVGKRVKRKEVKDLILKWGSDFCCLQESKLERVDNKLGRAVWGRRNFDLEFDAAEGNAGGVISIWDRDKFQKISSWSLKGLVVVNGIWLESGCRCTVINVYTPNTPSARWALWDQIQIVVEQYNEDRVCVIGDFNSVRDVNERQGSGQSVDVNDMENFNNFISDSNLVELQLAGRKFTWYRPDGTCKSKLDRMLVNSSWCQEWPDQILRGGSQSLLDHTPIFIESCKKDWGPKPFRFFNQWMQHQDFKGFVKEKWKAANIQGWGVT